jgi:hypothetical protein
MEIVLLVLLAGAVGTMPATHQTGSGAPLRQISARMPLLPRRSDAGRTFFCNGFDPLLPKSGSVTQTE